jgi:hypothetical protein
MNNGFFGMGGNVFQKLAGIISPVIQRFVQNTQGNHQVIEPDVPEQTNVNLILKPKNDGYIALQIADGTVANGNNRGINAVDLQVLRNNSTYVASGKYSFIAGSYNRATDNSNAAIGTSNSATGYNSCVIGSSSFATGAQSTGLGYSAYASGFGSGAFGNNSYSYGDYSVALAGSRTNQMRSLGLVGRTGSFSILRVPMVSITNSSNSYSNVFTTGTNAFSSVDNTNQIRLNTSGQYNQTSVTFIVVKGLISVTNDANVNPSPLNIKIWELQAIFGNSAPANGSFTGEILGSPTKTVLYDSGTWGTSDFSLSLETISGVNCVKITTTQDSSAINGIGFWNANLEVFMGGDSG